MLNQLNGPLIEVEQSFVHCEPTHVFEVGMLLGCTFFDFVVSFTGGQHVKVNHAKSSLSYVVD